MPRALRLALYREQCARWPQVGRHILAQFDAEAIVVYQAFRPSIAAYAVKHQTFGGPDYSFGRMSWVKPNFLWMMYRSGWGTKEGQKATLAIHLKRSGFESILAEAVPSHYLRTLYEDRAQWEAALKHSAVRSQWDPDHDPRGNPCERRAIQLGLRGEMLERFAREWILGIEDISHWVASERKQAQEDWDALKTPEEEVYPLGNPVLAQRIGVTPLTG